MRSHKTLIGPAASLLLLVACTTAVSGEPPDVFAPTPSIGEPTTTIRRTVTTIDRETQAMYRVDPLLNRLSGYQPLAMGDWWWELTRSPNQRWLLAQVENENGSPELRLIDLLSWAVSGTLHAGYLSGAQVTDDGVVYLIGSYDDPMEVAYWQPEMTDPEPIVTLPSDFVTWNLVHHSGDTIHILGFQQGQSGQLAGPTSLTSVSIDGTGLRSIPLPQVKLGAVNEFDIGQGPGFFEFMSPAVIWDDDHDRALIVNADRETITAVGLSTGEVVDHPYGDHVRESGAISAAMDFDSGRIYIASSHSEYTTTENDWASDTNPEELVIVDTASWETIGELDLLVSSVGLSPDGTRLLASGYSDHQTANDYVSSSTGSYLIDTDSLAVIAQLELAQENGSIGTFAFDKFSQVGYMTEYGGSALRINVIALDTGEIVSFREGDNIQVLDGLGVLGDRSDG